MKQKSIPRSGEKEVIITLISFLKKKKQKRQSDSDCVHAEINALSKETST